VLRRFFVASILLCTFGAVSTVSTARASSDEKNFTAEQVVESAILIYGSRPGLNQVRRNGDERGKITRITADGRSEEATYERRFVRGESIEKDKIRLDQKTPTIEYALVTDSGQTWGMINGSGFVPRPEASSEFISDIYHGIDALLRYKENGSTITMVGKDKQQNIDLYIIDLEDKDKRKTRFYISAKTAHVSWLEYEDAVPGATAPVKFVKKFYDYRYAQNTLVPYRTVLMQDGKVIRETRIQTVTYGLKLDDELFRNPDAPRTVSTVAP
jgi:hypothetical protein